MSAVSLARVGEVPEVVSAYWAQHRLSSGDRASRLRAESDEFGWASDVVVEATAEGSAQVLTLLDALLDAPEADPCFLGAGPVEELLVNHGSRFAADIALRCRQSAAWRDAVACVWLSDADEQAVALLRPFLPSRERRDK
jgi:hypothetical protein